MGFVSLGCPKNLVDSEVMMGMLDRAGAELTADAEAAEILVVNTCSFIDSAKQESVDTILEMAQHKTAGAARKLIVAGCLVERYRDEIRKNIPEVDAVVGTGELEEILAAAGSRPLGSHDITVQHPQRATSSPTAVRSEAARRPGCRSSRAEGDLREQQGRFSREDGTAPHRAAELFLRRKHAAPAHHRHAHRPMSRSPRAAIIPAASASFRNLRGKFRSRPLRIGRRRSEQLVAQGVREITLIGQDTTCYGEDFGMKDGLADLLDRLARIEGLTWLRFLYAYPNKVTAVCSTPSRGTTTSASTSTFRCSTRPPEC